MDADVSVRSRNSVRIDGLTVLRGCAIGLVLLRHLAPGVFGGAGIVGVTIFFALSGWLITGILLADLDHGGRIRFGRFFLNRVWRLYPALLVFAAVLAAVGMVWDPLQEGSGWVCAAVVAITYTADLPFAMDVGGASSHLWTLAVEEQFYLLWPFLLAFAFGAPSHSRVRRLRATVLFAVFCCWAAAVGTAVLTWNDPIRAYALPTSWFVALALGGFARTLDRSRLVHWLDRRWLQSGVVLLLVLVCLAPELKTKPLTYVLGGPLIAAAAVVLVVAAMNFPTVGNPLGRVLVALGTISYAVYLWNYALVVWAEVMMSEFPGVVARGIATVITLVVALGSWYLVERPVQRRRRRGAAPAAVFVALPDAPTRASKGSVEGP